jgi:tetratricopeptide (TPR) repeat protein
MENKYFTLERFNSGFEREVTVAQTVYQNIVKSGFKENTLLSFDFDFVSNSKENLESLSDFLQKNYDANIKNLEEYQKKSFWSNLKSFLKANNEDENLWILRVDSIELPFNENNFICWAIDLYCKGYEFDSILSGYGALFDPKENNKELMIKDYKELFNKGIDELDRKNFGAAIIFFSEAISENPLDDDGFYQRGYCKDEIYLWGSAREDYDEAIKINPNNTDALMNRGVNKDEMEEYESALEDYDKVLEIDPEDNLTYSNRGNTKFNLGDKKGACEDWFKAKSLGFIPSERFQERMDKECQF